MPLAGVGLVHRRLPDEAPGDDAAAWMSAADERPWPVDNEWEPPAADDPRPEPPLAEPDASRPVLDLAVPMGQTGDLFGGPAATLAPASGDPAKAAPASPWHRFPRGAPAGNFLHEQLEWLGHQGFALDGSPGWREQLRKRCAQAGREPHAETVVAWMQTPRPGHPARLAGPPARLGPLGARAGVLGGLAINCPCARSTGFAGKACGQACHAPPCLTVKSRDGDGLRRPDHRAPRPLLRWTTSPTSWAKVPRPTRRRRCRRPLSHRYELQACSTAWRCTACSAFAWEMPTSPPATWAARSLVHPWRGRAGPRLLPVAGRRAPPRHAGCPRRVHDHLRPARIPLP